LNQTFSRLQTDLTFAPNRIALERLQVAEGKGTLSLSGEITLDRRKLQTLTADLQAVDFRAVNLPDIGATLRANLHLEGSPDALRLTGNIELLRAVIQLSGLLEGPSDLDPTVWPIYNNLTADLRISARRNVWIKDKDLNLEIAGDVDLRKDREGVRLYGSLNSRRGRYEFQSTRFAIERAEIQFQGKPDLDPDLYILATNRIRLAGGEPAVINAIIGGTLKYPRITLESDPPMPMPDILSYLLLGHPAEYQGSGPGLENRAAGFVVGVAANQLKQTIGRQFNLDLVEIDAGGSGNSRIRVGKYIGQKLFVSYTQETGSGGNEVTVEYELLPQITLEAQQRVDGEQRRQRQSLSLFWKVEWK
ncbi:MAG: translocation/assembly module TamB, partial [bacterium]|nr:translocation/assembly module TamB [bacterium]